MGMSEKTQYPFSMRLGGPQGQLGRANILFPETFRPDMEFVTLLCLC
jgi:hypothetical protein